MIFRLRPRDTRLLLGCSFVPNDRRLLPLRRGAIGDNLGGGGLAGWMAVDWESVGMGDIRPGMSGLCPPQSNFYTEYMMEATEPEK